MAVFCFSMETSSAAALATPIGKVVGRVAGPGSAGKAGTGEGCVLGAE